jgi:tRNA threonylcarbamoyladenosine biosynthesis protein TsaB
LPILAIDTATETLSIALGDGENVLGETSIAAGRSHLELLLSAVEQLLRANDSQLSSLQSICVGVGPGTFSGLRVGVATARGLAQGLALPLSGSSSLAALAAGLAEAATGNERLLLPVIDAKRGQVFSQLFSVDAGKVMPKSEIMCLSAADLLTLVRRRTEGPAFAGGDGVLAYLDQFTTAGVTIPVPGDNAHHIQARHHLTVVDEGATYSLEEMIKVTPAYVREPDADKTILLRKKEPWLK